MSNHETTFHAKLTLTSQPAPFNRVQTFFVCRVASIADGLNIGFALIHKEVSIPLLCSEVYPYTV